MNGDCIQLSFVEDPLNSTYRTILSEWTNKKNIQVRWPRNNALSPMLFILTPHIYWERFPWNTWNPIIYQWEIHRKLYREVIALFTIMFNQAFDFVWIQQSNSSDLSLAYHDFKLKLVLAVHVTGLLILTSNGRHQKAIDAFVKTGEI